MGRGLESAAGDDLDDFEAIACVEGASMEFGRSHRLAVEFDDDASGKQVLTFQKLLQSAGEIHAGWLPVGDHDVSHVE